MSTGRIDPAMVLDYLYVTKFVDLPNRREASSTLLFLQRKGGRNDPGETDTQQIIQQ
jgi:hypothetical protein